VRCQQALSPQLKAKTTFTGWPKK